MCIVLQEYTMLLAALRAPRSKNYALYYFEVRSTSSTVSNTLIGGRVRTTTVAAQLAGGS